MSEVPRITDPSQALVTISHPCCERNRSIGAPAVDGMHCHLHPDARVQVFARDLTVRVSGLGGVTVEVGVGGTVDYVCDCGHEGAVRVGAAILVAAEQQGIPVETCDAVGWTPPL